jgi:hypothetical protein
MHESFQRFEDVVVKRLRALLVSQSTVCISQERRCRFTRLHRCPRVVAERHWHVREQSQRAGTMSKKSLRDKTERF